MAFVCPSSSVYTVPVTTITSFEMSIICFINIFIGPRGIIKIIAFHANTNENEYWHVVIAAQNRNTNNSNAQNPIYNGTTIYQ